MNYIENAGGVSLGILIACFVLGFLIGTLITACYYNNQARKTTNTRRRRAQRMMLDAGWPAGGEDLNTHTVREREVSKELTVSSKKQTGRAKADSADKPTRPEETASATEDRNPEDSHHQDYFENLREKTDRLYGAFPVADTLSLQFRHFSPEISVFEPGEEYLRSRDNYLIPNRALFTGMNTAYGYAMNGTFWVFHPVIRGERFTFSQIMEGRAGSGYVQPVAVLRPAVVAETNQGCYRLVQAGILAVKEIH